MRGKKPGKVWVEMVTIPRSKLESMEATIETLGNRYVMAHLKKSDEDIRAGRVRDVEELLKELQ